mmetsp:Transcript_55789/g.103221  ORF Transcript_55789/g.103221 Transcript_55789/m.103221 type:complete len:90 (+) Transcript_55789:488-757(+)
MDTVLLEHAHVRLASLGHLVKIENANMTVMDMAIARRAPVVASLVGLEMCARPRSWVLASTVIRRAAMVVIVFVAVASVRKATQAETAL